LSQKVLFTGLFGLIALLPVGLLWVLTLAIAGPLVARWVSGGALLLILGFYVWKLHMVEVHGRLSFFADRIEWQGPHPRRVRTVLEHKVLRYADIGHIERTASSIILRHGPETRIANQRMDVSLRPEQLDSLWEEFTREVSRAMPAGAVVSVRPPADAPTYYLPAGDPLARLSLERTVAGSFRIEAEAPTWHILAEGEEEPLVRIRRQSTKGRGTTDGHWLIESPTGELLAYLWKYLQAPSGRHYNVRGVRGEELGRLKVRTGLVKTEADLITGTQHLQVVQAKDSVRIEQDGQLVAQLDGSLLRSVSRGQLVGELPYLTFSLAVGIGVMMSKED
jgi:hypothetical protein